DVLVEYKSDMERMEHRIHESLSTDVSLIQEVSKYILGSGGKRLRPLLHLLSARLCGCCEHNTEYVLGSVVEYLHTASLLHDDVVDEAKIRRGRSSANSIWGNQASILVGDYLYSKALYHAVRLENQRVMAVLSETTTTMSEGEVLQLMNIQNADVSEADYLWLVECKTGVLIAASCRLGAIISRAPLSQEDALATYGKKLGLAFQITDDTLDYAADPRQLGKALGKDLAEGKVTLPLIYLMRDADPDERMNLCGILQADTISNNDLTYTLGLMGKYGSVSEALIRAQSLSNEAKAALGVFSNSSPHRALSAIADYVVQREM
ncbi:MAG TPA: polyprenyl synthetase family protein, partial [Nitrospirota bacterium]|nr:polyprenyl synthetase family protein [Nitrospirota bacterium]